MPVSLLFCFAWENAWKKDETEKSEKNFLKYYISYHAAC